MRARKELLITSTEREDTKDAKGLVARHRCEGMNSFSPSYEASTAKGLSDVFLHTYVMLRNG